VNHPPIFNYGSKRDIFKGRETLFEKRVLSSPFVAKKFRKRGV